MYITARDTRVRRLAGVYTSSGFVLPTNTLAGPYNPLHRAQYASWLARNARRVLAPVKTYVQPTFMPPVSSGQTYGILQEPVTPYSGMVKQYVRPVFQPPVRTGKAFVQPVFQPPVRTLSGHYADSVWTTPPYRTGMGFSVDEATQWAKDNPLLAGGLVLAGALLLTGGRRR